MGKADGGRAMKGVNRSVIRRIEDRPFRITEARRVLRTDGRRGLVHLEWREFLNRHGFYTLD
jgi:hypothetical protein